MDHRRKQWSTTTDSQLVEQLKALATRTRIPSTKLLDESIEDLLLKYKVIDHKEKTP